MSALAPAICSEPERTSAAAAEVSVRGVVRVAAGISGGLTLAVCVIALIVGLTCAASARGWLGYSFAGISAGPGEAARIFLHNLRALVAVGGLLAVAQSPYWAGKPQAGPIHSGVQRAGEALLATAVAANVTLVGVSLGAYGIRMLHAALPHGPVELAAYALTLALYLEGRHKPLPPRHTLATAALATSTLALAAALETFVNL